jgi:hypothetical protein
VDLWLRSEDWQQQAILVEGIPREFYLDARVVPTLVDLEEQRAGGAIWVVAGGLEMYQKTGKLEPGLRRLLKEAPAVWVGRDGWTRVLRLDAR